MIPTKKEVDLVYQKISEIFYKRTKNEIEKCNKRIETALQNKKYETALKLQNRIGAFEKSMKLFKSSKQEVWNKGDQQNNKINKG